MFHCIKTGFYALLPNGLYLYGDAFGLDGTDWPDQAVPRPREYLLLRVTSMSSERPLKVHITLDTWAHWFEETRGEDVGSSDEVAIIWRPCSTIIVNPGDWSWLGYNGVAQ